MSMEYFQLRTEKNQLLFKTYLYHTNVSLWCNRRDKKNLKYV